MNFLTELKEGLGISWSAIRANKLRSVLTTVGIVIGILTVTLMGTAIEGLNRAFFKSISFMGADVLFVPTPHDVVDTYLPAFHAAITEAKSQAIMCAYNAIDGEPACANKFLLQHTLRGAWKFGGYVVSDCSAVHDIFEGHHYRASQPEASAVSRISFSEPTSTGRIIPASLAVTALCSDSACRGLAKMAVAAGRPLARARSLR